jgi:hypothetical protein
MVRQPAELSPPTLDPTLAEPLTCPSCGTSCTLAVPLAAAPGTSTRGLRCPSCGARAVVGPGIVPRALDACPSCDLPDLERPADTCAPCAACAMDERSALDDARLVAASAAQAAEALLAAHRRLAAREVEDYVERIARAVARQLPDAPAEPRPSLVTDERVLLLALPPATLLVSAGALRTVRDEAELAFVVGHELAHLADPGTARRLARHGLALARRTAAPWDAAARALLELGHGDAAELAADRAALSAAAAAGYDPRGASSWLERLAAAALAGDARFAEHGLAHPGPLERLRRLDFAVAARSATRTPLRVNREPFRRAAGHAVLTRALAAQPDTAAPRPERRRWFGLLDNA